MEFVIFWVGIAFVVGLYAGRKGRSAFGFFLLSLLLSPLIGFLIAFVVDDLNVVAARNAAISDAPSAETHVRCPECRELVRKDARKCKHCGTALVPQ